MKKYLFACMTFVLLCGIAHGDFYKWIDENGATQITDYPPPPDKKAQEIEIHTSGSGGVEVLDETEERSAEKVNIFLYTKDNCPDCDKAREFFTTRKMLFKEYNMDKDPQAALRRKEIDDGDEVPLALINRNRVYGFSESVYHRALKIKP